MAEPVAIYVHIPFCVSKCGYCDFSSFALKGEIVPRTVDAIVREIDESPWKGRPAKTVFFGGGTPTFLSAEELKRILDAIARVHPFVDDIEVSSEANPGTIDASKFAGMREAGFNRISIGAQSFHPDDLKLLGRIHRADEIEKAVRLAREAGFEWLSLDLMFALPHQTSEKWNANLERAISLNPDHLSLYCLTFEPETPFYRLFERGKLTQPDEEAQNAMYDQCDAFLGAHGLERYEISNFAKPGEECRHNLCYWRGEEYIGYGPGAVGSMRPADSEGALRRRYTNLKEPKAYCETIETGATHWLDSENLSEDTLRTERIMLGIRLREGIRISQNQLDLRVIAQLEKKGWLTIGHDSVSLTPLGRHYCNDVAAELI